MRNNQQQLAEEEEEEEEGDGHGDSGHIAKDKQVGLEVSGGGGNRASPADHLEGVISLSVKVPVRQANVLSDDPTGCESGGGVMGNNQQQAAGEEEEGDGHGGSGHAAKDKQAGLEVSGGGGDQAPPADHLEGVISLSVEVPLRQADI
jgi:hypothetical protein